MDTGCVYDCEGGSTGHHYYWRRCDAGKRYEKRSRKGQKGQKGLRLMTQKGIWSQRNGDFSAEFKMKYSRRISHKLKIYFAVYFRFRSHDKSCDRISGYKHGRRRNHDRILQLHVRLWRMVYSHCIRVYVCTCVCMCVCVLERVPVCPGLFEHTRIPNGRIEKRGFQVDDFSNFSTCLRQQITRFVIKPS